MRIKKTTAYYFFLGINFISACNDKKPAGAYENNLGIKPGVIAQIDTANYTKISWEDTAKNFGMVKEGLNVLITYKFKNAGTKPLFLSEVHPSCGCTVTDYPQNAILPGQGGEVIATFSSSGHPGLVHKTITVISNSSNRVKQVLLLDGEVTDSLKNSKHKN